MSKYVIYVVIFILMLLGILLILGSAKNRMEAERDFCLEQGGFIIEPTPQTYNTLLCGFGHENASVRYGARKVVNEGFGMEVGSYCFSCWSSNDCSSPHNDVLRERGVHC